MPTNEPLPATSTADLTTATAPRQARWPLRLLLLLVAAAALATAFAFDSTALDYFAKDKSDTAGAVASAVSTYGDWPPVAGLLAVLFGLAIAARSPRFGRLILIIFLATALAGATACGLRLLTGRARPSAKIPPGWYGLNAGSFKYSSFPSAHTAVIAGGAAALTILIPAAALPGAALVALMAWARMRTGAHHLSDVVAGAILGGALGAWLATRVPTRWPPLRWFRPKESSDHP